MKFILITTILYSLLPLLLYWFTKNKLNKEIKPIFPFIVLCFIAGFYELVFTVLLFVNSVPWFYAYDFLAFFTIQYFFYHVLERKIMKIVIPSTLLYLILFSYAVINNTLENYFTYLSYLTSFITLLILIYSIMWFKKVFMEATLISLTQSSTFYFVSGFLCYYMGILVLFLFANSMYFKDRSYFQYYWLINLFFNFFHKTLLQIGIWKSQKKLT